MVSSQSCFHPQVKILECFFAVYNRNLQRGFFLKKKLKNESYEEASPRSWGLSVAGCQKETKTVPSPEEKEEKQKQKWEALRRRLQERRQYDEMVVKTCLLGHIKDPCKEKLRDAIEKRVDS